MARVDTFEIKHRCRYPNLGELPLTPSHFNLILREEDKTMETTSLLAAQGAMRESGSVKLTSTIGIYVYVHTLCALCANSRSERLLKEKEMHIIVRITFHLLRYPT